MFYSLFHRKEQENERNSRNLEDSNNDITVAIRSGSAYSNPSFVNDEEIDVRL
jgi:hypothetical protein